MSLPEGFNNKYLVVKWEDIEHISQRQWNQLDAMLETIEERREFIGKSRTNDYIVVNTDEPYIDEIVQILKRHGHWG